MDGSTIPAAMCIIPNCRNRCAASEPFCTTHRDKPPPAKAIDPNLVNCVPGRWRCPKCKLELTSMNLNMVDGTVTARDAPGEKCPNDGTPMWRVSYQDAYNELAELAQSERFASIFIIERLVRDEGASVTILCQNPEGTGPDNHAIEVNDDWTGWKNRRFMGPTLFAALLEAEAARTAAQGEST